MTEIWKPVEGYEGLYEVSNLGRVRSFVVTSRILKGAINQNTGYVQIRLFGKGRRKITSVHRLVCMTFHGKEPFEGAIVLHRDDCPTNNRSDNLRWGSHKDNRHDRIKNRMTKI